MEILGIDIGQRRIGLAIANSSSYIAQPLRVLNRKNIEADIKELKKIIEEYKIGEIIMGFPLNMYGHKGKKAKEAIDFADLLRRKLSLKVRLWDERLTTVQGEKVLLEADMSRAKRKKVRDKLAAQLILQSYLDAKGSR
jgi:putative Holliday junction resolvase